MPLPNTQNPLSPNIWMWYCCAAVTSHPCRKVRFPLKRQMFVLDLLFTEVYRKQFDYSKEINKRVTTSILDKDY